MSPGDIKEKGKEVTFERVVVTTTSHYRMVLAARAMGRLELGPRRAASSRAAKIDNVWDACFKALMAR